MRTGLIFLIAAVLLRESRGQIKAHVSSTVECGKSYQVDSDLLYYFGDEEFGLTYYPSQEILYGTARNGGSVDLFNLMSINASKSRVERAVHQAEADSRESDKDHKNRNMDRCRYSFFVGPDCKSLKVHFTRGDVEQMECENQMLRFIGSEETTRFCNRRDSFRSQAYGRFLKVKHFLRRGVPRVPIEGYVICE